MKIVVIDDSMVLLKIAEKQLEKQGHTVYTADNGYDGIRAIMDYCPDLIIVDYMMPYLNGKEIIDTIASHLDTNQKVFLLTNLNQQQLEAKNLTNQKFKYLHKPFNVQTIMQNYSALA